jgi:hypothetical protein
MTADRLKESIFALVRAALPTLDYYALYRGKVVTQSGDKVDVIPDDSRIPDMSAIPIKLGLPGVSIQITPGAYVLIGWEGGDSQRPYVMVWETGANVVSLTLRAAKIELGGPGLVPATDGVVRAATPCQFTGAPHFVSGGTSLVALAKAAP